MAGEWWLLVMYASQGSNGVSRFDVTGGCERLDRGGQFGGIPKNGLRRRHPLRS